MDRALSFGSAAADYHRYRPGYPSSLVDLVVAHGSGETTRALEIGAGTGKATAVFAGRVPQLVAVEPDPDMRAVLAKQIALHDWAVEVVDATFETLDPERVGPFDLLYAAAAFHWTDPTTRWDRAVALVRPGGVVAVFGAVRDLGDRALRDAVHDLTTEVVTDHDATGWTLEDLQAHPGLTDVVETALPQHSTTSAVDYVGHLSTLSAFRVLPPAERAGLLARVRELLPETVDIVDSIPLHLARRSTS